MQDQILLVDDDASLLKLLSIRLEAEGYEVRTAESAEQGLQMLKDLHPIGHPGEPIDIAYGILYLASNESKFVTGSELVIDGGYTAR